MIIKDHQNKGMKIYTGLIIIFVLVILLGSLPISEGFYRPTLKFLKNTVEAVLEKQLEKRFGKSGNAAPYRRLCYWRWRKICIGALPKTKELIQPKTYPVYISPNKAYELLFEMF